MLGYYSRERFQYFWTSSLLEHTYSIPTSLRDNPELPPIQTSTAFSNSDCTLSANHGKRQNMVVINVYY